MMRAIFALLLLFASPVWAQQTIGDAIKDTVLQVVEDECDTEIRRAMMYTEIAIGQAQEQEWDYAFRYMDEAFGHLLRATDFCEDDSEQKAKAETYLEEHSEISKRLECSFHSLEARNRFTRGKMAIEHFNDWESALFHTNWAMYYVEEAIARCAFDPERVKLLLPVQEEMYRAIEIIEETIDGQQGSESEVPG